MVLAEAVIDLMAIHDSHMSSAKIEYVWGYSHVGLEDLNQVSESLLGRS